MSFDPVELLTGLLSHYSPSGQESDAAAYLLNVMKGLGFTAWVDGAGNAVGSLGKGPKEILLLGHIDTVPGFITVERRGDALYGRGSVDAKGPLACFVAAAAHLAPPPGWKVTVVGAVGEESNSAGACFVRDTYSSPDMVVIGEPSGWDHVTLGYKGSLWIEYTLRQPYAHTAARTVSGCESAVAFWNRVQQLAEQQNEGKARVFDQLTPSLRRMYSEGDGFIETVRLGINLRLPPAIDCGRLIPQLVALATPAQLEVVECSPAYRAEKNTPLVRAFLASIRQRGGQPGFTLKSGTSDMNTVGPSWGCPIVAYGPGDSDLDHTPEEHILVSEYQKGIEVLAGVLALVMDR